MVRVCKENYSVENGLCERRYLRWKYNTLKFLWLLADPSQCFLKLTGDEAFFSLAAS